MYINYLKRSVMLLLSLFVFLVLPHTYSTATSVRNSQAAISTCELTVDGPQLITETKAVVADLLHVSPSQVTASYCCQLTDDRFKYSASSGTKSGFVYWIVSGDQIIVDDLEGF